MHDKRFPILLLWLIGSLSLPAQEKGFLFTFVDAEHSWSARDAVETESGDYIIGAWDYVGHDALLWKLSSDGGLLDQMYISAEDTTVYLSNVLYMPDGQNGDFVAFCPCEPVDGAMASLLFIRFDDDLNVTMRKVVSCPFIEQDEHFFSIKALSVDTCIYAAFTMQQGSLPTYKSITLTTLNSRGDFLNCQRLDSIGNVCSLFCPSERSNRIGLFGPSNGNMAIQLFDEALSLVKSETLYQWTAPEGNNGEFCLYYIIDAINSQALMLPNGSFMVSSRLNETLLHSNGYPYKHDRSVILARYGNDFQQPENLLITEHMNDSIEYPAFFRSLDFRKTGEVGCDVFQCCILHELPQYGLIQPYPTGLVVTKADQNLNVEWKKRFLRDGIYQAMTINATADGGCLVVGSVGDYQAQIFGIFALKINAEGTVGTDEILVEDMASVYPNPVKETLKIGGVEVLEVQIYNTLGQLVKTAQNTTEVSLEGLPQGVYLLRVTLEGGKVFSDKVVKE